MIHPARLRPLNDTAPREGRYVLYWMQASQRTRFNHALEYAIRAANERGLPVIVGFGLMDDYPDANARHYAFMLQGLRDVEAALRRRGVKFVLRHGPPDEVALRLAEDAALVVADRGYLRHQVQWRSHVGAAAPCPVIQVETDVVVPVEQASQKLETAARTLRPKLARLVDDHLRPLSESQPATPSLDLPIRGDFDPGDVDVVLDALKLDRSVGPVRRLAGGSDEAARRFAAFLADRFGGYAEGRNEPSAWGTSFMSPYLHFGQISPVELALVARQATPPGDADRTAFLDELIVRRELSMNFVAFNPDYHSYRGLPAWAQRTLSDHASDRRDPVYTQRQLEDCETRDAYWNASMAEMRDTGFMHNHMRMYWGKKILEWTPDPAEAHAVTLAINNKYFLCGRDPNSYANVAWIFGQHDRPWQRRPIFGNVRYMNARGLDRKFDMAAYEDGVRHLVRAEREPDAAAASTGSRNSRRRG